MSKYLTLVYKLANQTVHLISADQFLEKSDLLVSEQAHDKHISKLFFA